MQTVGTRYQWNLSRSIMVPMLALRNDDDALAAVNACVLYFCVLFKIVNICCSSAVFFLVDSSFAINAAMP